jgi:hypothetical protein
MTADSELWGEWAKSIRPRGIYAGDRNN